MITVTCRVQCFGIGVEKSVQLVLFSVTSKTTFDRFDVFILVLQGLSYARKCNLTYNYHHVLTHYSSSLNYSALFCMFVSLIHSLINTGVQFNLTLPGLSNRLC
jgi:hypothetical protein